MCLNFKVTTLGNKRGEYIIESGVILLYHTQQYVLVDNLCPTQGQPEVFIISFKYLLRTHYIIE